MVCHNLKQHCLEVPKAELKICNSLWCIRSCRSFTCLARQFKIIVYC